MPDITAYVTTEDDGQLVLHDPAAEGVIAVVEQHNRSIAYANCQKIYEDSFERVQHFRQRLGESDRQPADFCIVVIQVDDCHGGPISELLMPGHDWKPIRDQGLIPIARGFARRNFIHDAIAQFDQKAAEDLEMTEYAAVVIADSVARVFAV